MDNLHTRLQRMADYNSRVDINNFFMRHLVISKDDYDKLSSGRNIICNCCFEYIKKCKNKKA